VSAELVDEAIAHIRQRLLTWASGNPLARTRRDGHGRALPPRQVAYIRFASVYRSFQGVDDFRDVISRIGEGKKEEG